MTADTMAKSMERKLRVVVLFGALYVVAWGASTAFGIEPTTLAKLRDALYDRPNTISAEEILRPENADLRVELTRRARVDGDYTAKKVLIRIGDKDVIQDCLNEIGKDRNFRANSAVDALIYSKNPDVIAMLGDILNRNENPQAIREGGDLVLNPPSVRAAGIINALIENSGVFKPEVVTWSRKKLVPGGAQRQAIRAWWTLNQSALQRKDYAAVVSEP